MRKLFLCLLILNSIQSVTKCSIKSWLEDFLYDMKLRMQFAKPYVITGSLASAGAVGPEWLRKPAVGSAGIYALYAWYTGFHEIAQIQEKYSRATRPKDYWTSRPQEEKPFLFCRWRQLDNQFGDGYYWPTAWWMTQDENEKKNVLKKLIEDINSNRIILIENGKRIERPRPDQVLKAIARELQALEADKELLKRYTTVYRKLMCAEEFKPDTSYFRILWPNYNRASRVYIELVTMIKRLEALGQIISNMKVSSGGNGWPQVR
jgi:hypothetical protein